MRGTRIRGFISRALVMLSIFGLTGCADVQGRYVASPLDARGQPMKIKLTPSGLIVSGEELRPYSSPHFGLIEVTFENLSTEWVHVERLALDFGSPEKNAGVFLPQGGDLEAWHWATIQRNDIRGTNEATALDALLALGTVVAAAGKISGRRELAAVGGTVALGAATAAVIGEHEARVDRAEHVRLLPETYLLAVPFAVPPGLFAKKWVLLETRRRETPCITAMRIEYDVERGNERVLLVFRRGPGFSRWQRKSCTGAPAATSSRLVLD